MEERDHWGDQGVGEHIIFLQSCVLDGDGGFQSEVARFGSCCHRITSPESVSK